MTDGEAAAIRLLSDHFTQFRDDNREGHDEIKTAIKELRDEVNKKFDTGAARFTAIEKSCADRELKCAALLAARKVEFEAEIAAAELNAVAKAKEPSVYVQATKGLGKFLRVLIVTV